MTASSPFFLLRPEDLSALRSELAADRATRDLLAPLAGVLAESPSDAMALAAARRALEELALAPSDMAPVEDDPEEWFESHANDQSFEIVRVHGPADRVARIFAHSALRSLVLLLEDAAESGTELDAVRWARLRGAFATIVAAAAGPSPAPRLLREIAPAVPPAPARAARDALRRWTRGHYAFMAIVQGLVVTLQDFAAACDADDPAGMRDALAAATAIMWGAESALRFAGDFAYTAYEKAVRPTLMPPIAPPGMTGLHWRDHRFMVSALTRLRGRLAGLPEGLRAEIHGFHAAMAEAYESHKYVCSSFVGTEQPSLLMATRTEQTAIETLDHFKTIRLALLDGARLADAAPAVPAPKKS